MLRLRLLGDGGAPVFDVRCLLSFANTSDRTIWRDCNSDIHLWCGTKTLITCPITRTPLKNRTTSCTDRDMGTKRMDTRHNPASAPRDRPTLRGTISLAERSICNYPRRRWERQTQRGRDLLGRHVLGCHPFESEEFFRGTDHSCCVNVVNTGVSSQMKLHGFGVTSRRVGVKNAKYVVFWHICWMESTIWRKSTTLMMFILMLGFFCPYDNPKDQKIWCPKHEELKKCQWSNKPRANEFPISSRATTTT